jgi:hypothetical protein
MVVLTTVSLQFDGKFERLEHAIRKAQGIANLWTITIWMKPFEVASVFDQDNQALFEPDGRALLHFKGATHRNEILVWGERIENETSEEYIVVENWDNKGERIRVTRFNLAQKREEWRNFSCAWDGSNLIAWNNGTRLTDIHETYSGIVGSFIMNDDPNRLRSVRLATSYSGGVFEGDKSRIVSYSGLLGPIGIWNEVLGDLELGEIASGTFGFDLSADSGTYTSSVGLQHRWRLGGDAPRFGKDYVGIVDVDTDATVTSGSNIVVDSP